MGIITMGTMGTTVGSTGITITGIITTITMGSGGGHAIVAAWVADVADACFPCWVFSGLRFPSC
ncbi:MAG: hypothetical protein FWE59_03770 [Oscillospiraceae bacterium]|nr:hypothetical protein [Oscillospiraceae bacterium]